MFAWLIGTTMAGLAMPTMPTMLVALLTPTRPATTSRPTLRRAIRWPHPLGVHPIHDPVELFDDAIETAGGITWLGDMLRHRPFFGRPHIMNPASDDGEHRQASGDRQPFQ
jgi:hypothetical protein